nr:uncharacterized protein LOC117278466 [Nicotiana tomentosiformis]
MVRVMVRSLWTFGGLFIHLGMIEVDLRAIDRPEEDVILHRVGFVDSTPLFLEDLYNVYMRGSGIVRKSGCGKLVSEAYELRSVVLVKPHLWSLGRRSDFADVDYSPQKREKTGNSLLSQNKTPSSALVSKHPHICRLPSSLFTTQDLCFLKAKVANLLVCESQVYPVFNLARLRIPGSSNPEKVKRVRGKNKCKEVASLEVGQKLKVTFYNNRMVGTNSKLFSRHLGRIVRDRNMCSLGVSSWNDIKQEKLNHMWAAIEVQLRHASIMSQPKI